MKEEYAETFDIHDRKIGQAPLESKEGYEFLVNHSKEIILVLSKRGKIIFANKSALTIFGYSKEEISGLSITHFLTKNSMKKAFYALAQEFLGRPQPELEVQAKTKSGEIRYLNVVEGSVPIHANGKIIGIMISAGDITEQRKARIELHEGEKRFRDLWENAPAAYHTVDTKGTITNVNQTEADMLGYRKEELVGKSVFEFILPEQRLDAQNRFQKKISGQHIPREENRAYVKKDGSKIYVAIDDTLERDNDGKIVGIRSTMVDITKLREAKEGLKRSEEHFKDLVEKSGIAILIDDREGNLKYYNARYAEIFGYSMEEMKKQTIWSTVHPDDAEKLRAYHRGRHEGKDVPSRYELKALKKDGSVIYLELDVAVLKEGEQPIGTRTYMWDITERKQAELLQNAVYHISRAADKSASLNDLFKSVHEIISTVMPAKNFYISLYDDKNDLFSFPYFIDEFDVPPPPRKPRKGLTEYVLRTGRSLLCDDVADQELRQRGEVELVGSPSSIWLGVPLTVDNKAIGVMVVQHYSDPSAYGQRELRMLEYVSSQIAKSIERKRAEDAIRRQVVFDNLINKLLARFANSTGSAIDDHVRPGLQEIGQFMGADDVFVILTSSDSALWSAVYDWHVPGSPDWLQKYQDVPMGTLPWTEKRLLGGEMIQISALDDLPPEAAADRQKYEMEGVKSLVEVPLRVQGGLVIGWIGLRSYTHQIQWSRQDVQWLQIFGDSVANVLERKQAEAGLRESEKRYRELFDHVPVGLYRSTPGGKTLEANPALLRMLGYPDRESMLKGNTATDYANPEDRERWKTALEKNGVLEDFENKILRQDGKVIWVKDSARVVKDEKGRFLYYEGALVDFTKRKKAEEELSHTVEMLRKNLGATIQAISTLVETRDPYTAGHQRRVADLARAIAKEMGLSQEQVDGIRMAGLIHDIGKVSVPAEILSKPGQLTELEFSMIKIHAQYGYEILKPVEFPGPVAQTVLQHHERIDGSGYPSGLKDEEILIEAKILAVADVVEAMISHRPYRPARSLDQALEEITKNSGALYDPKVVEACLRLFVKKGFTFREKQDLQISPKSG
jgi:PAS domain S-box-containing protein/putative nucleotidyltransferase with HDIG domain